MVRGHLAGQFGLPLAAIMSAMGMSCLGLNLHQFLTKESPYSQIIMSVGLLLLHKQVVGMSRAEMAALRSSLPSQKKYKGRILAEKMGVKTGDGP